MSINVLIRLFAIGNEKVWKCGDFFFSFRVAHSVATTKISSNRKINFHLNDEKTATTNKKKYISNTKKCTKKSGSIRNLPHFF